MLTFIDLPDLDDHCEVIQEIMRDLVSSGQIDLNATLLKVITNEQDISVKIVMVNTLVDLGATNVNEILS